jgi:hypothetical protein
MAGAGPPPQLNGPRRAAHGSTFPAEADQARIVVRGHAKLQQPREGWANRFDARGGHSQARPGSERSFRAAGRRRPAAPFARARRIGMRSFDTIPQTSSERIRP